MAPGAVVVVVVVTVVGVDVVVVVVGTAVVEGVGLVVGGGTPGAAPSGDYSNFGSRALRTHANSVENLSAFALLVIMAMFVGADPAMINLLAMAHVAARILYWIVYYAGLGPVGEGLADEAAAASAYSNTAVTGSGCREIQLASDVTDA